MKDLLEYLLAGIVGKDSFSVSEESQDNFLIFTVTTTPEQAGLIIGKAGKTIKALRNILRVRATLENKGVSINVVSS